jgi:Ca2+-binding EF-hand superfamily protein
MRIDIGLCLFKLIDGELRSIDRLERAKKSFNMQTGKLQLRNIFESIEAHCTGSITPQDLQGFLKAEGKHPTLQMCDRIVRFCMRYSARSQLDFEAFTYCMLPKILTGVSSVRERNKSDDDYALLNPNEQGKRIYTWTNDSSYQSTEHSDHLKQPSFRDGNHAVRAYFAHLVACIRQLEDKRTDLAMRYDMMDFTRRGILKQEDFQRFFDCILADGMPVEQAEVGSLLVYYDKDQDGCIGLEEFRSIFMPFDVTFKSIVKKRESRRVKYWDQYNLRTRRVIRDLFRTALSVEHSLNLLTASLTEEETKETFRIIDRRNLGKVDVKRIMVSLLSMGVSVTYDDIVGMVERLDLNDDLRVSYDEFMRELSPRSAGKPLRRI